MVERPKIGIGVDMESVARFERFVQRPGHRFLQHAFLQSERYYCFSRLAAAQHLAARWAGKEAVIKALSAVGYVDVHWQQIEIVAGDNGAPQVRWRGASGADADIYLSLSHSGGFALAFVLVQRTV